MHAPCSRYIYISIVKERKREREVMKLTVTKRAAINVTRSSPNVEDVKEKKNGPTELQYYRACVRYKNLKGARGRERGRTER